MERITKNWIEKRVEILRNTTDKNYQIDYAYGGVKLVIRDERGCEREISQRLTKRQLSDQITTILNVLLYSN